ncbi:hypothetical protein PQO03_11560 [Lentisphaera profundi]|uniref:Uncharacterized protein n=1 Tax=Lentisphaera profundi TaxID=1658616 RepID=A0ABY7VR57_9BACT|nr:hypothetical protein [Lentisphaera profundi]WDE96346.1 hypothetical protein PQO03_11560 [Lentisphaera profundi]
MKILILNLLLLANILIASPTKWSEKEQLTKFENSDKVFVGFVEKIVFFSNEGKMLTGEEIRFHLAMQNYLHYVATFKEIHTGDIDLMPDDKKLKEKLNIVLNETKKERESLINYYEKKLNDYPWLQGKVTAKVRLEEFYKGKKSSEEYIHITFEFTQHTMCPHLIQETVGGGRWVWYKLKNKYEVQKFDHNEHKKRNSKI